MRIESKAVPLIANEVGSMHHIGLRIIQTPVFSQYRSLFLDRSCGNPCGANYVLCPRWVQVKQITSQPSSVASRQSDQRFDSYRLCTANGVLHRIIVGSAIPGPSLQDIKNETVQEIQKPRIVHTHSKNAGPKGLFCPVL